MVHGYAWFLRIAAVRVPTDLDDRITRHPESLGVLSRLFKMAGHEVDIIT